MNYSGVSTIEMGQTNKSSILEYIGAGVWLALSLLLAFHKEILEGTNLYVYYTYDATPFHLFYPAEVYLQNHLNQGFAPIWDHLRGLGEPNMVPILVSFLNPLRIYLMQQKKNCKKLMELEKI